MLIDFKQQNLSVDNIREQDELEMNSRQYNLLCSIYNSYECELGVFYDSNICRYEVFADDIRLLNKYDYIKIIELNLKVKANRTVIIELTDKGKEVLGNEYLEVRECDKIVDQHANYIHGYTIKLCVNYFKRDNLKVITEHKQTRYIDKALKLGGGRAIEPDFVVEYKHKKLLIEVEVGGTRQDGMDTKMQKYSNSYLDTVIFICPNSEQLKKTKALVDKWKDNNVHKSIKVHYINASVLYREGTARKEIRDIYNGIRGMTI